MKSKIVTFDIFDTLFLRACGDPYNIFFLLARRVLGDNINYDLIREFVQARIEAELKAVQQAQLEGNEDVDIYQIYDYFKFNTSSISPGQKEEFVKCELEIEKSNLIPVRDKQQLVEYYRKKGYIIGFISDMYLPEIFIRQLLIDNNYYKEHDFLLISSSYKKKKSTGSLFKLITKETNIPAKKYRWTHYGDNVMSDGMQVLKNGGKSHLVDYKNTYYQEVILNKETNLHYGPLKQLASLQKAILYKHGKDSNSMILTDLMIPLIIPYAYYVLQDANKKGIKTLYYFSRDSYYLYNISKALVEQYPYFDVKCKYLQISRKVIYLPSLIDISYEEITQNVQLLSFPMSVYDALEHFSVTHLLSEKQKEIVGMHCSSISDGKKIEILKKLFSDQDFVNRVTYERDLQKHNLLGYLSQEGFLENDVAFVDISGTRRSQVLLNRVLYPITKQKVHGYYLANLSNKVKFEQSGPYNCLMMQKWNGLEICGNLLEDFFSLTDQGRTESYYEENGIFKVKTQNVNLTSQEEAHIQDISSIITDALNVFINNQLFKFNDRILDIGVYINNMFALNPHSSYLENLNLFMIHESKDNTVPFVAPLTIRDYKQILKRKNIYSSAWRVGSIVKYMPFGKNFLSIVYRRNNIRLNIGKIVYYFLRLISI